MGSLRPRPVPAFAVVEDVRSITHRTSRLDEVPKPSIAASDASPTFGGKLEPGAWPNRRGSSEDALGRVA